MTQHEILKKFISGLSQGLANSLVVVSRAGYGKTETTMRTLEELGLQEGKHYRYLSNYITAVEFFNVLQEVNKLEEPRLLILDDVETTLKNDRVNGLLKSALWDVRGRRRVCWISGTHKIDKKEFDFNGRIIFLLNDFKIKNPIIFAIKDRGFYYEIELTIDDMFELMRERAKVEYLNIPYAKRKEIVDFLQKVGAKSENITLRILPKAYNMYLLSPNHWQNLIMKLL